ncbi:MAG: flippase-like domain-containing protein [Flavobacteriales bacterium]|nr:flippase-like domain-containing protein [Flavobacteriales bacterium]
MLKTKQNRKKLFVFAKLILFAGVLFLIYLQLRKVGSEQWNDFHLERPLMILLSILLVIPNIYLAFLKWKITLKTLNIVSSRSMRVQSFFAGIVTGLVTPNMIGNFLGRFYYFNRSHRIQITLFTLISNFGQFVSTITFGWIAVLALGGFLSIEYSDNYTIGVGLLLIGSYLSFFFIENFALRFRKKRYFLEFKSVLMNAKSYRLKILALSGFRFLIFTLQYSLMIYAFGEELNLTLIFAIWQVYLITMVFPSLILGKIGIKEVVGIAILGALGVNEFAVIFTSLIIWFVNTCFPALVGLTLCRSKFQK